MSLASNALKGIRKGDVVRLGATAQFSHRDGGLLIFKDVKDSDVEYELLADGPGALTVEMVKRARRQNHDFFPGQVITGDTLREVMWKRGTVIRHADIKRSENRGAFVLAANGHWYSLDWTGENGPNDGYLFEDFVSGEGYRLEHIA